MVQIYIEDKNKTKEYKVEEIYIITNRFELMILLIFEFIVISVFYWVLKGVLTWLI